MVTFVPVSDDRTRVTAVIGYAPESIVEKVGDKSGLVEQRVAGDLERFKTFIEERGMASGAWRGEIHGSRVEGSPAGGI